MSYPDTENDRFYDCCFRLEEQDIYKLDKEDNGPIHNVIAGIDKHCYGARLYDDQHGVSVEIFYINGTKGLRGDIIQIEVKDKSYFELLIRFCMLLADNYLEVDAIAAFNTFQKKVRGFLEKLEFFTVTSQELEQFRGRNAVMMTSAKRGIIKLDFIDPKEFYRDFFDNLPDQPVEKGMSYVYLMVNTDTGLIKIGHSTNPGYRERTLHSKEPTVHLIAIWRCSKQVEKDLHEKFRDKRIRGEWFRLTIGDLTTLAWYMADVADCNEII